MAISREVFEILSISTGQSIGRKFVITPDQMDENLPKRDGMFEDHYTGVIFEWEDPQDFFYQQYWERY